ncbi:hypothetical protein GWI33_004555 [Rhynchophorus ferrugineus]|uniref:C-type lectin domain-containing protein n=1 Tax=Rhynchophorus ferrugineus TaxID=354439 RepID=A0A834MKB7_RHYFE|nr:hypothetical protein GWI33_004555 [Rhynchophorus ferrugineus]
MMLKLFWVLLVANFFKESFGSGANETTANLTESLHTPANRTFTKLPLRLGDSRSFHLSSDKANFFRALVNCQQAKFQLAAILSENDEHDLNYALEDVSDGSRFWLSGTQLIDTKEQGNFYWFSGGSPVIYTKWLKGEPNSQLGNKSCIMWEQRASVGTGWSNNDCLLKAQYICQTV